MRTEKIRHENVLPDGTFSDKRGAVETDGGTRMSQPEGGCGIDTCNCSEGHWLTVIQPRTEDGIVEGVKYIFDNQEELNEFVNENEVV